MSVAIIITLCVLLLIAYIFDLSSKFTRIPSVILLLLLGWLVKQGARALDVHIPDMTNLLPVLGSVGLILIVMEGSLDLELDKSKKTLIGKSLVMAVLPIFALAFALAWCLSQYSGMDYKTCLLNAIPLSVISSSIAIPSAKNLNPFRREFIVYESSFSDIIGVLFFNFILLNEVVDGRSFGIFGIEFAVMMTASFIATVGLALLLKYITHHIKFAPIILLVILIYEASKIYHLPGMIFILVFGLFIGNLDQLKRFKWINRLDPDKLEIEVHKFREIVTEAAFLVRSIFFMVFGYLIKAAEVANLETLPWAAGIVIGILLIRAACLYIMRIPLMPMLFIAPRGLITILLFLAIPVADSMSLVNNSLVIQVVLLAAIVMMLGLLLTRDASNEARADTGIPEPVLKQ